MASKAVTPGSDGEHLAMRKSAVPYDEEIAAEIVLRIANGETLTSICASDPKKFPSPMGFARWTTARSELGVAHAHARMLQAEALAEETLRIVDAEPERVIVYGEDGEPAGSRIDAGSVQWAKMRAEQRMKLLAKWAPEKYGEKLLHAGHDGKEIKIDQRFDIRAIADQLRNAARSRGEAPGEALIDHQPSDGSDLV